MKKAVFILLITAILLAGPGCFRKSADTSDSSNANVGGEFSFANITDANQALDEGNRLLDENQTDMAIEAFRQAVKLNPDLAEAYFKLGIAYSLFEKQMQTVADPGASGSDDNNALKSEKAFLKAVEVYKKWVAANPNDDMAYYNLGRAYSKLNKDDEAEKALRQAAKLKPDDAEYETELGTILIRLAKYHEAIVPLKKAIEIDASNARAADLLDDAEAGAKRLDYNMTQDKDADKPSNSKTKTIKASNANANTTQKPPDANTKPIKENQPPHFTKKGRIT